MEAIDGFFEEVCAGVDAVFEVKDFSAELQFVVSDEWLARLGI